MGGIIKAICKCGFETDFMGGSSATNYSEVCNAPAICFKCKKIIIKNYLSDDINCQTCSNPVTFYNHKSLQQQDKNEDLTDPLTRELALPEVNCLCQNAIRKR